MNTRPMNPLGKAALASAVIFLLGAVAGGTMDRVLLARSPAVAAAATLTPEGMAQALNLDAAQGARVNSVLDSLSAEVSQAVQGGPDSLRDVARRARQRLENALPPDRRASFQTWMQQHHARMMEQMGGGIMGSGAGMTPGMMQSTDTTTSGMMGRRRMGTDSGRGGMMHH